LPEDTSAEDTLLYTEETTQDPVQDTLHKALETSDSSTHQFKHTTSLRLALRELRLTLRRHFNRHADLIRHSSELSAAADRLQEEQAMTILRGLATIKVDRDEFPAILGEIDDAVEYFGKESECSLQAEMKRRSKASDGAQLFSGSVGYYRRAVVLQEAVLYLIKEDVADRVSNTT